MKQRQAADQAGSVICRKVGPDLISCVCVLGGEGEQKWVSWVKSPN